MRVRRPISDIATFLGFVGLTIIMTWPWVRSIRDYSPDTGDSYLSSWILWWDYHQTFHHPLHLFDASILFPYRYTLAFSEHSYGIALLFFPLHALGLRPLTVHGIAVLVGFAFSGYGAFRLARTLSNSNAAAWIAGVAFAFVPFRFHHLPHVTYVFSGWIPLTLEALVLYARRPNARRGMWLGVAFFMNALTCIHWFLLTLIPLATTAGLLMSRYSLWRNRRFWLYAASSLGLASVALLPFLMPYVWVKNLYGFERRAEEATFFSAHLFNWLMVDWRNKLWRGLGSVWKYQTELALFPGFVPPLLAIAAFRFRRETSASGGRRKALILGLDVVIVGGVVITLLFVAYGKPQGPAMALVASAIALAGRLLAAAPNLVQRLRKPRFCLRRPEWLTESLEIGLVWTGFGFIGSFGMNFFFHRLLFEYVPIFRSIRVPARWAMICFVGLSLLAGAGAIQLAKRISKSGTRAVSMTVVVAVALAMMCEQRAAPLALVHGAVDPDPVTLRLKDTPMRGGILELPSGVGDANYVYTLRAADHAQPLVDSVSGFKPPIQQAIDEMINENPFHRRLIDLIEAIPVSYVVVHHALMSPEMDHAARAFFDEGVAAGRFRLVATFGEGTRTDDLYLVTRTEVRDRQ